MAIDAHGIATRMFSIDGSRNDRIIVSKLTNSIDVENLIADKAYDTNDIFDLVIQAIQSL